LPCLAPYLRQDFLSLCEDRTTLLR